MTNKFTKMPKHSVIELAKVGDAEAQYYVAIHYSSSKRERIEWIKKAALNGCTDAIFNLANRYRLGMDVEKDKNEAISLYKKAANLGHGPSKSKLKELTSISTATNKSIFGNSTVNPRLEKYIPIVDFDDDYDARPRFNSEYDLKAPLHNRLERACDNFIKYFDSCHSAKLSRPLCEYYSKELDKLGVNHSYKDLKDELESILIKYYRPYYADQLVNRVHIGKIYGKYYYNVTVLFETLGKELKLNRDRYANEVYEHIKYTYNIK